MSVYNVSPIFNPQFIANAAAALTFAPQGGTTVPINTRYQINTARVVNVTNAPVALTIWIVPSGSADDNQHLAVPVTVVIPVASQTFPHFDATVLWGLVLNSGDAIWAQAGTASALTINGSGAVVIP